MSSPITEHRCIYCKGVVKTIRISCAFCWNYDLCIECFLCGVESGTHQNNHDYIIMNDGFSPLFTNDSQESFTLKEELALVEGVEHYGCGNWDAVSCLIPNRTAHELRIHFERHYLSGSLGALTGPTVRTINITDHTGPVDGPLSPTITAPLASVDLTAPEALELGFLPMRDDFEREYDNEAEQLLAGAMVHHADDELDIAYKLALVSMYRLRLRERVRRKRIARQFNLASQCTQSFKKAQSGAKKKSLRDYKVFQEKMRTFAQFFQLAEHDSLFAHLQKEKLVKTRIRELVKYRKNGITTFEDALNFERESSRRDKLRDALCKKLTNEEGWSSNGAATSVSVKSEEDSGKLEVKAEPQSADLVTPLKSSLKASVHNKDLLSENEKQLCKAIGMKHASYITLKASILKDYLKRQHGTPVKFRFPPGFDPTHRRKILTYLEQSGWLLMEH